MRDANETASPETETGEAIVCPNRDFERARKKNLSTATARDISSQV